MKSKESPSKHSSRKEIDALSGKKKYRDEDEDDQYGEREYDPN